MPVRITPDGGSGAPNGPAGFTDAISLNIKLEDVTAVPTDDVGFALELALADVNADLTETMQLKFPAGVFDDLNAAPTDTNSFALRVWLSGTTMVSTNGVTNPANANGQNNGVLASYQSAALGDANPRTTSVLGANVPVGVSVASAIIRAWFRSVNTLVTSNGTLVLRSLTALFADKPMFSNAALNTTIDHLGGTFTYDLVANGVDSIAKIQSAEFLAATADAVAGITPHVLTLDAACVELAGAFA